MTDYFSKKKGQRRFLSRWSKRSPVIQIAVSTGYLQPWCTVMNHPQQWTTVRQLLLSMILHQVQNSMCTINCVLCSRDYLAKAFNKTIGESLKTETAKSADAEGRIIPWLGPNN